MPIKQPENPIWAVYSHLPGGQLVAVHFEDIVRIKKVGDGQEEIRLTSKEQLEAFKRSPQVALYLVEKNGQGKLIKNEMLVYSGDPIHWKNPRVANLVLDWARAKGAAPVPGAPTAKGDSPKTYEYDRRIKSIEDRIDSQDKKLDEILQAISVKK